MTPSEPIRVLSRVAAIQREPLPGEVCISIRNPRQSDAPLPDFAEVIQLGFHDTDRRGGNFTVMSLQDANQVLSFARRHRTTPMTVHCEFGASRSVAVGLFVALWLERPLLLSQDILAPNPWVLRQLSIAGLYQGFRTLDARLLTVALGDKHLLCGQVVPAAIANTYR